TEQSPFGLYAAPPSRRLLLDHTAEQLSRRHPAFWLSRPTEQSPFGLYAAPPSRRLLLDHTAEQLSRRHPAFWLSRPTEQSPFGLYAAPPSRRLLLLIAVLVPQMGDLCIPLQDLCR